MNGLMTLSFAVMGICWIINELFVRVAAVNEHDAGVFARIERSLVPSLAIIWVILHWIPEWMIEHLGLGTTMALMLSSQLVLQLLPWLTMPSSTGTPGRTGGPSSGRGNGQPDSIYAFSRLQFKELQRLWFTQGFSSAFYWLGVGVEWTCRVALPYLFDLTRSRLLPACVYCIGMLYWNVRRVSTQAVTGSSVSLSATSAVVSAPQPRFVPKSMPQVDRSIGVLRNPDSTIFTRRQILGFLAASATTVMLWKNYSMPTAANLGDLSIGFKSDLLTQTATKASQPVANLAKTAINAIQGSTYIPSVAVPGMALQLQPLLAYHPPLVEDVRKTVVNANEHAGKLGDVRWLVIHHSGTAVGNGVQFTLYHKDWSNTPYHFVIEPNGHIQWLQDLNIPSYNAGFPSNDPKTEYGDIINNHAISVCMVGNFDEQQPSMAQLAGLDILIRYFQQKYNVAADHVLGHRECLGANTRCPGANFQPDLVRQRLAGGEFGGLIPRETALRDVPVSLTEPQRDFCQTNSIPEEYFVAALKAQAKWGIAPWVLLGLAAQESGFGRNKNISAGVAYEEVAKNPRINAEAQRQALSQLAGILNVPVTEIKGTPGEGSLGAFQFQPSTFMSYAMPNSSPFNPDDAADAAARLLVENGWTNDDSAAQQTALKRWNTRPEHTAAVLGFAGRFDQSYRQLAATVQFA
jgi:hypothetical protein